MVEMAAAMAVNMIALMNIPAGSKASRAAASTRKAAAPIVSRSFCVEHALADEDAVARTSNCRHKWGYSRIFANVRPVYVRYGHRLHT